LHEAIVNFCTPRGWNPPPPPPPPPLPD